MQIIQDISKTPIRNIGIVDGSGSAILNFNRTTHNLTESSYDRVTMDIVEAITTGAGHYIDGYVSITGHTNTGFSLESSDQTVAIIVNGYIVQRVSPGVVDITISHNNITRTLTLDLTDKYPNLEIHNTSWVVGSLGEHLSTMIDARLVGANASANGLLYTSQNHATGSFIRNPAVWCNDVDKSCISPTNSVGNNFRAGVAVTPRHVVNAHHYPLTVGASISFITDDGLNTTITRTIVGQTNIVDTDIELYVLDTDLPASITPCKVATKAMLDNLKSFVKIRVPALVLDQEEKALVYDVESLGSSMTPPTDETRSLFCENLISGDSGNPGFLILENELVLLSCWAIPAAGPSIGYRYAEVNAALNELDISVGKTPTHTLTNADTSSYPTYT